jgi:hypothetical protein
MGSDCLGQKGHAMNIRAVLHDSRANGPVLRNVISAQGCSVVAAAPSRASNQPAR